MQSSSSKNSKLPNNTSQIEENDNIIRYFGKNIYETNNLCDFKENAFSFWELKFWKFESCENSASGFLLQKIHVSNSYVSGSYSPSDSLTTSWLKFLQASIILQQAKM